MDETTIRVAIRATARISFVLFLGAFVGNALFCVMPSAATRWLKANKDGFILEIANGTKAGKINKETFFKNRR